MFQSHKFDTRQCWHMNLIRDYAASSRSAVPGHSVRDVVLVVEEPTRAHGPYKPQLYSRIVQGLFFSTQSMIQRSTNTLPSLALSYAALEGGL